MSFEFQGKLPASKSLVNRWIILASHFPQIQLSFDSTAEDVLHLKNALADFKNGKKSFFAGKGGTTFRFLSLFLSRYAGQYFIEVDPQLRNRSQESLTEVLTQLGVMWQWNGNVFSIQASGWRNNVVQVSTKTTTQTLSGVLLNCWNLDRDLSLKFENPMISNDYFEMTLEVIRLAGLNFRYVSKDSTAVEISIEKDQVPLAKKISVECDISSAFAVGAMAIADGVTTIEEFPFSSIQPDIEFVSILEKMGVPLEKSENRLKILRADELKPI